MLLGESRTWDEHHRAIEKVEYIPTDSESIRGARSENRPRGKIGVSGLTKPIIQWTLKLDRVLTEAAAAGGKTVLKPFDMPNRGRIAAFKDPGQGATFGVVQSGHGDPEDRMADINEWLWNEVWTDDVPAAVAFYQRVGGYRLTEKTVGDTFYRFLERDGQPRVGLLDTPSPRIGNTWAAYIPGRRCRRGRK